MVLLSGVTSAQNIVFILSDDQGWTGSSVQMDSRVAESMHDELKGYLESVDTKLPMPNPDYDPSRDGALLSVTSAN